MSVATKPVKKRVGKLSAVVGKRPEWRWYHGIAFYLIVQVLAFGLSGLVNIATGKRGKNLQETFFSDVPYFKSLKQAVITPPSWAFAPAWTINNISVIWGNLRVLNKPDHTPGRDAYLALQAVSWLDFIAFNAAYFSLRSPINALILSVLMLGLTVASAMVALFKLRDTKVALSLATLFIWLLIATTAATYQALWNRDALYNVGPFVKPDPALVKQKVR